MPAAVGRLAQAASDDRRDWLEPTGPALRAARELLLVSLSSPEDLPDVACLILHPPVLPAQCGLITDHATTTTVLAVRWGFRALTGNGTQD
ncbi:MAG: hypothetical protein AAF721_16710 [Myxococcota bacterium]